MAYRYDPALDAQLAAVQRGLFDTQQDIQTQGNRLTEDYGIGVANAKQSYDYGIQDLGTARTRTGEDYQRQLASLQRSYDRLGRQQSWRARGMNIMSGGTLLAAARRRAANQAWDRQPIDTGFQRANQDFDTRQSRLTQSYNQQVAQLGLGLTRGQADLGTQGARAQREADQFGIDTAAQRSYLEELIYGRG